MIHRLPDVGYFSQHHFLSAMEKFLIGGKTGSRHGGHAGLLFRGQYGLQRPRNRLCNVTLNGEYVFGGQLPVVGLRPQMLVGHGVDQLHVDTNLATGTLYSAFQNGGYTELFCQFRYAQAGVSELFHRCPGYDLQIPQLGQQRQQVIMHSVDKKNVLFQRTAIGKRQDRDGLTRCSANTSANFIPAPVVIECEVNQRYCHHTDDKEIQFTPRFCCHGLLVVNFSIALDSFWRQFKCPGENQRDRQTGSEHQQYQLSHPRLQCKNRSYNIGDLQHQPTDHRVGEPDAKNMTAFQFFE